MSTITCTAVVLAEDPAERVEAMAVGGFLAGYAGATRTSYATDLRIFAAWCRQADVSFIVGLQFADCSRPAFRTTRGRRAPSRPAATLLQ